MNLRVLAGDYAVCRLGPRAPTPPAPGGPRRRNMRGQTRCVAAAIAASHSAISAS
jgi:hypothetical protein